MIGKELESDEVGIRIRRKDPQMGLGGRRFCYREKPIYWFPGPPFTNHH